MQSTQPLRGPSTPILPAYYRAPVGFDHQPVVENTSPSVFIVQNALFWNDAKPHCPAPGVVFTRDCLTEPKVARHFGQCMAQSHNRAETIEQPVSELKTALEARDLVHWASKKAARWGRQDLAVEGSVALAERLVDRLHGATPKRIFTDYNWYPEVLSCDAEGNVTNSAGHTSSGYHAWFEPLCRLDYTSRGTHESFTALYEAYAQTADDDSIKQTGRGDVFACRQLFNLLYLGYFLKCAVIPPRKGTEAQIAQASALERARELKDRILADDLMLKSMDLPHLE